MISLKKYYYISAFFVAGLLGSCSLGSNENPDAAYNTTLEEVTPVVMFYGAQINYDIAEYGTYLTQTLTTGGRSQTGTLAYKSGWEFLTMNRHPQWRRHYYDIGVNAREMIALAQERKANNYELIGKTIVLMSTLYTTDLFGDMPLSEAYTGKIAPKYDTQQDIYNKIYGDLDVLLKQYNNPEYANASTNAKITQSQDRIFAGDMDKWKAFAYGLRARAYLRSLPNWKNTEAYCDSIIISVDSALLTWQEPLYQFDGGADLKNCPWGPAQPIINSWESRKNELDASIVSQYFAENILGVQRSLADMDPRAEMIMKKRSGPENDPNVKYRYLQTNFGMEASYTAKHFPDLYNAESIINKTVFTRNDSYVPYMLTEELLLMKAEAQYWKGLKAEAFATTKEAVTINMNRHGVSATRQNYYFRSSQFMPEATFDIGHLMRQKYVCMYLQAEQWTDMRRYKYSNNINQTRFDGVIIYPNLRRPFNLYQAYWGDNENAWVQRLNYDPETEEKYNRKELIRLGAYKNSEWLRKPMIWAQ